MLGLRWPVENVVLRRIWLLPVFVSHLDDPKSAFCSMWLRATAGVWRAVHRTKLTGFNTENSTRQPHIFNWPGLRPMRTIRAWQPTAPIDSFTFILESAKRVAISRTPLDLKSGRCPMVHPAGREYRSHRCQIRAWYLPSPRWHLLTSSSVSPHFMQILGIGSHIVEVLRIAQMIERHDEVFLRRVFTDNEITYCSSQAAAMQHYASVWSGKEAVLKSLGSR